MNEQPKLPPQDNDPNPPSADEADMANLALDLQKIEGYDPAAIEPTPAEPILPAQHPASSELPNSSFGSAPNKNKKKWIISGIAAAVVLALGVGSWATYALWFQNPDKVVTDALFNAISSKTIAVSGSIKSKITTGDSYAVAISLQGSYKDGTTGSADVSYTYSDGVTAKISSSGTRTANGDMYLKLSNLNEAYASFTKEGNNQSKKEGVSDDYIKLYNTTLDSYVNPIIAKIEDKWLSLKVADFEIFNKKASVQYSCENDAVKNLMNDKDELIEIGKSYQKHKLVSITQNLGMKDGNLGFVIKSDKDAAAAFYKDLQNTKFYITLKGCDKTIFDSKNESSDSGSARTELWIDQWSHQLKRVTTVANADADSCGKEKQTISGDFSFKYDQPLSIAIPKPTTPLGDLLPKQTYDYSEDESTTQTQCSTSADSSYLDSSKI